MRKHLVPSARPHGSRLELRLSLVLIVVLALIALPLLPLLPAAAPPASTRVYQPNLAVAQTSTSADWSGYATTGLTYTSVSGAWTQPRVTCGAGETSYSAFWVGLDGDTTRTVEQVGTESNCDHGIPVYDAWYEMYPAFPVTIDRTVAAADQIKATVIADGTGGFTLTLSDATQGWSVSTPATQTRAELGSAEWIAETPSDGRRPLPLADFKSVNFTQCTANGSSIGANPNLDPISLATRRGGVQAQPSDLTGDGLGFSVMTQPTSPSRPSTPEAPGTPFPDWPSPGHHHHHWLGPA